MNWSCWTYTEVHVNLVSVVFFNSYTTNSSKLLHHTPNLIQLNKHRWEQLLFSPVIFEPKCTESMSALPREREKGERERDKEKKTVFFNKLVIRIDEIFSILWINFEPPESQMSIFKQSIVCSSKTQDITLMTSRNSQLILSWSTIKRTLMLPCGLFMFMSTRWIRWAEWLY